MLQRLGHTVVAKTSSVEALDAFLAQPDRFDLVITDMSMPKMSGTDLSREMLRVRPDIPIILCTGYSEKIDAGEAHDVGLRDVLMKPVLMANLTAAIHKALKGKETDGHEETSLNN